MCNLKVHFFSLYEYFEYVNRDNIYFFLLLFCTNYLSVARKMEVLRSIGYLFLLVVVLLSLELESVDEISW